MSNKSTFSWFKMICLFCVASLQADALLDAHMRKKCDLLQAKHFCIYFIYCFNTLKFQLCCGWSRSMPANILNSTECTTSVNTKMLRLRKFGTVIHVASSAGHAGTSGQMSTKQLRISEPPQKNTDYFSPLVNINGYNCDRLDSFIFAFKVQQGIYLNIKMTFNNTRHQILNILQKKQKPV